MYHNNVFYTAELLKKRFIVFDIFEVYPSVVFILNKNKFQLCAII